MHHKQNREPLGALTRYAKGSKTLRIMLFVWLAWSSFGIALLVKAVATEGFSAKLHAFQPFCYALCGGFMLIIFLEDRLSNHYIELMKKHYLNGFSVCEIVDCNLFYRLAIYFGVGLCYEQAALAMLISRENSSSRLCIVRAQNSHMRKQRKDYFCQHAWVEFQAYGLWWVLDPWEYKLLPRLRLFYRLSHRASYRRIVSYNDFWTNDLACKFHSILKNPHSKYRAFSDLSAWRCLGEENMEYSTVMIHEKTAAKYFLIDKRSSWNYYLCAFKKDKLLTPRIIRHFLIHHRSLQPKAKDYRRAKRIVKSIR